MILSIGIFLLLENVLGKDYKDYNEKIIMRYSKSIIDGIDGKKCLIIKFMS